MRLDSWKEIAEYLGKGERTVKRWETERSLPVHRVPGSGHGSVYAYAAELDDWLVSEKPKEANSSEDIAGQPDTDGGSTGGMPGVEFPRVQGDLRSASPGRSGSGWSWRILAYAFLFVGIALAFVYFTKLRTTNAYTSSYFHSLLSRARSSGSGSSSSVSDSEKQLAHELYLRGRFEWNRRTPDSLNRALDYFTQSIVHDAGNAQAYVGLADTYNLLREYTLMPENEAYARAIAAARKAIELDDSLAEAHRALAFDEVWGNWDFQAGEREFQRAIELNPRDPVTHLWFANAFASPGWFPVCLREIDRAQELDPTSKAILADKGLMLYHAGQTEEGVELVRQVERADPDFLSPHRYLADMYLTLRDYPNFLKESEKTAELSHDQVLKDTTAAAKSGFHRDGEHGLLQDLYLAQKKAHAEGELTATILAETCAHVGKKKEALRLLREDYEKHSAHFLKIRQNLELLTLRDEPGYQELLKKIHSPVPESAAAAHSAGQTATLPSPQALRPEAR